MKQKFALEQILEHIPEQIVAQDQETDAKYYNFIYTMDNRNKSVFYNQCAQIELPKAIAELNGMDWTYVKNGISFINLNNDDGIFGHRVEQNKWHITSPVKENGEYYGYQWSSCTDHESLLHTMRLFFEESSWFETQRWNKILWENDF